ncbi:hypothetical protein FPV67DRAFT_440652 [Lyophyllum atratum]|nr:hypothetical protein FPV67DRAFT_440652 [Lyophyllum atratum]
MPAPAVYILAIVGTIAAGLAFKEFVYEPHIAPKVEQWAEEFIARRQARRRQRAGGVAVPVRQRERDETTLRSKRSDSGEEGDERRQSIELENLIAKEVREWRSEVDRSQLRHRGTARGPSRSQGTLSSCESTARPLVIPMSPTHVLVDPSIPSTPSSTLPSVQPSPSPRVSSLRATPSQSTLRSPPPHHGPGLLPTPAASASGDLFSPTPLSPTSVPSLSQSYPQDLDHEHGLELLSAPSSQPDSPFSSFSQPLSAHDTNYLSFGSPDAFSPGNRPPSRSLSDLDFLSDFDEREHEGMSPRSGVSGFEEPQLVDDGTRSEGSGSSWASAGGSSRGR